MQVFRCFMKIVRHNLSQILIYLCVFIFLTIGFSAMGSDQHDKLFTDSKVNITVIDNDGSELSAAVEDVVYGRNNKVEVENDPQAFQDALYNRDIEYALFIPQGYEAGFLAGENPKLEGAQIPNSYSGVYVDNLIERFVSTVSVYTQAGEDLTNAIKMANKDISKETEVKLTGGVSFNMSPVYYYYSYMSYSLMLMMIFGLSPVLMAFAKKPLAMRMNSSALSLGGRNLGMGLGSAVLAAISFGVLVLIGFIMYGSEMLTPGSLICLLNGACFILLALAMAFFIGQIATSMNMLSAMANAIVLSLSFLGGIFVPTEIMSSGMKTIAQFMPTYWYVSVPKIAMSHTELTQGMMTEIWQGMGIQILFAVAFMAIALVMSKRKTVVE